MRDLMAKEMSASWLIKRVLGAFLVLAVALTTGIVFSFLCYIKNKTTKSFLITTALIPSAVAMVIMLVNGNIGAGIAVAGAFSLVRFRSAQGSAKEICTIFISMAAGLAFGMGYLAYGSIFIILAGVVLLILDFTPIWNNNTNSLEKTLKITIPEDLNYTEVFDDIFEKYTKKHELIKTKTTNMGSMFKLTYNIILIDAKIEKEFVDEIRCRNANLEIEIMRTDDKNKGDCFL